MSPKKFPLSLCRSLRIGWRTLPVAVLRDHLDVSDTVTKVWGNHTFKAGISFEYSGENDGDEVNT